VSELPAINEKGDPWIIARLQEARRRNRIGDNPNLKRARMVFDFKASRVIVEAAS